MRHISVISQGAVHPSALWRACNGTLGAIHKVHSAASRLAFMRQRKGSPESVSEKAHMPPHPRPQKEVVLKLNQLQTDSSTICCGQHHKEKIIHISHFY